MDIFYGYCFILDEINSIEALLPRLLLAGMECTFDVLAEGHHLNQRVCLEVFGDFAPSLAIILGARWTRVAKLVLCFFLVGYNFCYNSEHLKNSILFDELLFSSLLKKFSNPSRCQFSRFRKLRPPRS